MMISLLILLASPYALNCVCFSSKEFLFSGRFSIICSVCNLFLHCRWVFYDLISHWTSHDLFLGEALWLVRGGGNCGWRFSFLKRNRLPQVLMLCGVVLGVQRDLVLWPQEVFFMVIIILEQYSVDKDGQEQEWDLGSSHSYGMPMFCNFDSTQHRSSTSNPT